MDAYNGALAEVEKGSDGKSSVDIMIHTAQQVCFGVALSCFLLFQRFYLHLNQWIPSISLFQFTCHFSTKSMLSIPFNS